MPINLKVLGLIPVLSNSADEVIWGNLISTINHLDVDGLMVDVALRVRKNGCLSLAQLKQGQNSPHCSTLGHPDQSFY